MSVLPPDVISDWSQDFCPWAGIATGRSARRQTPKVVVPGFLPLGRHCDHLTTARVPGFLPLGRHCDERTVRGRLQAIRVPGFLPLGRHCDDGSSRCGDRSQPVPGFLPLGKHCDMDI